MTWKRIALLWAIFFAMNIYGLAANAQAICGKRTDIVEQLEIKYGETRRSVGLQQGRGVIEVYANSETGSWTILITNARGTSCLMAAGEAFEANLVEEAKDDPI